MKTQVHLLGISTENHIELCVTLFFPPILSFSKKFTFIELLTQLKSRDDLKYYKDNLNDEGQLKNKDDLKNEYELKN